MDFTLVTVMGLLAAGLVAAAGYVKNKITTDEGFDIKKAVPTALLGVVMSFSIYATTGAIPDSSVILQQLMAITGAVAITNPLAMATQSKLPDYQAKEKVDPGLKVIPTYTEGQSPLSVEFEITASPASGPSRAERFVFDFGDGSSCAGSITDGRAVARHTYLYQADPKYTGKTYYPDCRIFLSTGESEALNTQVGRYAISVTVYKPES